jgi:hypothetical protein
MLRPPALRTNDSRNDTICEFHWIGFLISEIILS